MTIPSSTSPSQSWRLPVGAAVIILGLALVSCTVAADWHQELARLAPIPAPAELEGQPRLALMTELLQVHVGRPEVTRAEAGQAYGELGLLYHASGQTAAAEACYRNARRLAPQDHRWPYYLAYLLQQQGQLDEALASWVNTVALRSTSVAMIHMAESLLGAQRRDEAAAVLGNALRINPGSAAALTLLGEIALSLGRHQEALNHYREALGYEPEATLLHQRMAQAYRWLGDQAQAEEHDGLSSTRGPTLNDPLIAQLELLRNRDLWHLPIGELALRADRLDDAIAAFRRAAFTEPDNPEIYRRIGNALEQKGDFRAAAEQYHKALDKAPDSSQVTCDLGRLLVSQGAVSNGIEHLLTAVALNPENSQATLALAEALVADGQLEPALPHFAATARLVPDNARAWLGGSSTLIKLGRPAAAKNVLAQAHTLLPQHDGITRALARLLATSTDNAVRDGHEALKLAIEAYRTEPSAARAETVAVTLNELGCCTEAVDWQQKAISAATAAGDQQTAHDLATTLPVCTDSQPCPYLE